MSRIALLGLLLAACGASSNYLGRGMYSIECRRSAGNCYEEAAYVCPYGFDVVTGDSQRGAIVQPMGDGAMVTPTYSGNLLVQCRRDARGRMPVPAE